MTYDARLGRTSRPYDYATETIGVPTRCDIVSRDGEHAHFWIKRTPSDDSQRTRSEGNKLARTLYQKATWEWDLVSYSWSWAEDADNLEPI